ncbi:TVP38/TMEM64 family inner membrane protein YdjZ [Peribacillus sp. Bi96]|uniref:TVP38/TMEM64 family protein n=1 Tax=unclassified Peribacillus TaxID=2675266 RepID=UPI001D3A1217|nr:VTT domain-containing protein [Peribacillus sp. Bi96]CAH0191541.1 TVP38/TMEM64 family inner membrane protein YdjZ [Peribacillus sp. Bi96]
MNFISEALASSGPFSIAVSIALNILISVLGFIPSVFITAANITAFGFEQGLIVSYIGEITGAVVSFWLYRKGFQTFKPKFTKNRWIMSLQKSQGYPAFWMILLLRLLPFIPSGVINLTAALSKTGVMIFFIATSIGKLPALLVEAYSVTQVLQASDDIRTILVILILIIAVFYYFKRGKNKEMK